MTSPPPMPDQPFTIRDGGKMWQHVLDGASVWGVTGPMYDDVGMPCLVVTGDVSAARARLAPDSDHLLADALLAIIDLDGCRGDCGDQTGACVPARIRAYLGWETTHE